MLPTLTTKVFAYYLLNPEAELTTREVADLFGESIHDASAILVKMSHREWLTREKAGVGRDSIYSAGPLLRRYISAYRVIR